MAELNLPFGPWKKIVSADWNGRPLSVYLNPENLLLLTLFDKDESGNVKGLLVLLKKPFVLEGSTDAFSSSQKRELVFIEKRSPDYHVHFLLLESTPFYIPYSQSEMVQTVQRQYQELTGLSKVLLDAALTYDVSVRELSPLDTKTLDLLIGDPFTLFSLSGAPPVGESLRSTPKAARLFLGSDAQKAPLDVGASSLSSVFILGGDKLLRLKSLHVLAESALTVGIPVVLFDAERTLAGLSLPTKNLAELSSNGLNALTAPLPVKSYSIGKGFFLDLRAIDQDAFETLVGVTHAQIQPALSAAYPNSSSLEDLVQHLSAMTESKSTPQYALAKTLRAIRVLQKAYPAVFGKNTFDELCAPWDAGVAKAYHVDLFGLPEPLRELAVLSVLGQLKVGPSVLSALCLFSPSSDALSLRIKELLRKKKGIGWVLHGEHESDFEPLASPSLALEWIGESLVATEPHKEKRRFRLRPLLTTFSTTGIAP